MRLQLMNAGFQVSGRNKRKSSKHKEASEAEETEQQLPSLGSPNGAMQVAQDEQHAFDKVGGRPGGSPGLPP
jgi:hypothetical protein